MKANATLHNNNWVSYAHITHSYIITSIYNVLVEPKWLWLDVLCNGGTSSEIVESESVWSRLNLKWKLIATDLTLHKILGALFLKNLLVKTKAQVKDNTCQTVSKNVKNK